MKTRSTIVSLIDSRPSRISVRIGAVTAVTCSPLDVKMRRNVVVCVLVHPARLSDFTTDHPSCVVECDITCHATCSHLVPDFCGITMEKANVLLHQIQEIKSHQKQVQPKKKTSAPSPQQQQQYPQQPYGQQQLPPIPGAQPALPPVPPEQQQWGRQQPPQQAPPRTSGAEGVAGEFADLRLSESRDRDYQQQQQQQQQQRPRPGSTGPPQQPGYPQGAGRVPPPAVGYPDRSGSPYRGTSMDMGPDGVPNAVSIFSSNLEVPH